MNDKKINVLVVDDSTLMRRMIIDKLNSHPRINVIGHAINGQIALDKLEKLKPDVITLDIEMPFMNGLETLREIQRVRPTPTIMVSSLTKEGADITIQALELGAFDFIQKPDGKFVTDLKSMGDQLISKILMAAEATHSTVPQKKYDIKVSTPKPKNTSVASKVKTVIIGSSTGGPQALKEVVPYLSEDLPAQILIVQHMPPRFTDMLAQRLNGMSSITVREAKDGDVMATKTALLAPGNYHMCIAEGSNRIKLNQDPPVWGVRPSVDPTLISAAKIFKEDLICVILTGMGRDGTAGTEIVKKYGGYCIAEHESTCIIYGMPKSVVDAGYADEITPLNKIADSIVKAVYR